MMTEGADADREARLIAFDYDLKLDELHEAMMTAPDRAQQRQRAAQLLVAMAAHPCPKTRAVRRCQLRACGLWPIPERFRWWL